MKSLGDRMKVYEATPYEHIDGAYVVPNDRPIVARIDGHCFSKFTKGFEKPYDERFACAMIQTASDLLQKFHAQTAYTQSDEITLVFMPSQNDESGQWREWDFRGRVIKWCSLLAGYASARFNHHLTSALRYFEEATLTYTETTRARIEAQEAHFDARVFTVPDAQEAYNNVYWRMMHDCARNSVHGLARCHFSSKALHGKNREQQKEMLREQKGVEYDDMPDAFKYGTFVKKQLYTIKTVDRASGMPVDAVRSRVETFQCSSFDIDLIERPYL